MKRAPISNPTPLGAAVDGRSGSVLSRPKSLWTHLPKDAHRYEIAVRDGEPDPKRFTLYSKAGARAPVLRSARGRSVDLGESFDEVLQQSVLLLVAPHFFQSGDDATGVHAGSLAPRGGLCPVVH